MDLATNRQTDRQTVKCPDCSRYLKCNRNDFCMCLSVWAMWVLCRTLLSSTRVRHINPILCTWIMWHYAHRLGNNSKQLCHVPPSPLSGLCALRKHEEGCFHHVALSDSAVWTIQTPGTKTQMQFGARKHVHVFLCCVFLCGMRKTWPWTIARPRSQSFIKIKRIHISKFWIFDRTKQNNIYLVNNLNWRNANMRYFSRNTCINLSMKSYQV